MDLKTKSLIQFNNENTDLKTLRNSYGSLFYNSGVDMHRAQRRWPQYFLSGIKKFALRVSNGSGPILSHYTNAMRNQPPREWLWHFLRDVSHLIRGLPALQDSKMELKYGTWRGVFFCKDEDGRLLGENTAVLNHPSIAWQERRFSDSRGLAKVNNSALRQMSRNWRQLVSDVAILQRTYARRYSIESALSIADLYYLSRVGTSIPSFLVRRKANPVSAFRVPVRFATIYKVLAGVQGLIITMIAQHKLDKEELHRAPSSLDMFEFGDKRRQFITPTGHACAGSRAMILELLDVLIHGKQDILPDGFCALGGDLDNAIQYGICSGRIDVLLHWNNLMNQIVRKENGARHFIEEVSKHEPNHIVEACSLHRDKVSEDVETVSECLRALLHHGQDSRTGPQTGSFSYPQFDAKTDLNGVGAYLGRQDEVLQLFQRSMDEINRYLGHETSTAVCLDDIYQRKCNHFTDQVFRYLPQ